MDAEVGLKKLKVTVTMVAMSEMDRKGQIGAICTDNTSAVTAAFMFILEVGKRLHCGDPFFEKCLGQASLTS